MDVVDSQIHLFMTMTDDVAVAVMDQVGISAALIDEAWALQEFGGMPYLPLPGGGRRPIAASGIAASARRPDRFSYLLRVNPQDPDIEFVLREARASPGCRALRMIADTPDEVTALAKGDRMKFFEAVARVGMPLFVGTRGPLKEFEPYIRSFPSLPFIVDHCGGPRQPENFEHMLELAQYPNVFAKWVHAPVYFFGTEYPFPEVRPFLVRTLERFGRERVMWGSDFTMVEMVALDFGREPMNYSWAESLFYMRDNPDLSAGDLEWVLGRTLRTVLDWNT